MTDTVNIKELNERIEKESAFVDMITMEVNKVIVGQRHLIDSLLIGLLTEGHVLLEGVPGLAKTLAVNTLAQTIDAGFSRIQFTPDLLPADLIGTMIYSQKKEEFEVKKGPIFSNFILADEINRSPAKVQSALLEAMQEKQVTIGATTFELQKPFMVLATQNPIEQEGTYPLPEAQVDRFMLKVVIDYPSRDEEQLIVRENIAQVFPTASKVIKPAAILDAIAARCMEHVYLDGGQTIQRFLAAGLVDGLIITRIPVLLGEGIPLFGPLPGDLRWTHVETLALAGGLVQSTYRAAG